MVPSDSPATFESFQAELARLVSKFDRQHPTFTSPDYNEQTLRADFLDQFFAALGWDVGNRKGLIHTEREVDIEVRSSMSGRQTRADYVFRTNRIERSTWLYRRTEALFRTSRGRTCCTNCSATTCATS